MQTTLEQKKAINYSIAAKKSSRNKIIQDKKRTETGIKWFQYSIVTILLAIWVTGTMISIKSLTKDAIFASIIITILLLFRALDGSDHNYTRK